MDKSARQIGRGRRRLFKLVTLAVGVFVGLLIAELALRALNYSSPQFYETDAVLGYRLIPGMSGWYSREGRSYVEINSEGFRDVEHTVDKPPGVYRIAVIGDSYVEGLQVGRDESFTNYIPPQLVACGALGDRKVEILRFGVSGYGTAQELLLLRKKVLKYSPDLLLLVMTTNNDITDNVREFKAAPIPYFTIENGELREDDSFRQDRAYIRRSSYFARLGTWLTNHLRVVQATNDLSRNLKYRMSRWREAKPAAPASDQSMAAAEAPGFEPGIENEVYREPRDDRWRRAWAVTDQLLVTISEEAMRKGVGFVVVLGSNGIQVYPNAKARSDFAAKLGVADLEYPNRHILELGQERSFRVIDLVPSLAKFADDNQAFLHGFADDIGNGHWNVLGHKVAGETLGSELCSTLK